MKRCSRSSEKVCREPKAAEQQAGHEILQIIAYLRNMGAVAPSESVPTGNVANGAQLFAKQCQNCHRVAGKGGRIGPDLTRIGAARTHAALVREIRTPNEWIPPAWETVTVVTKDGRNSRRDE